MIHDILEEPNLSEEAREFFEHFLKYPEEFEKIVEVDLASKRPYQSIP